MRALAALFALMLLALPAGPCRAAPGAPRRRRAGAAGARHLGRPALPRLPEPVDRRFGRSARARPRLLVRDRLQAGYSNQQVFDFVVQRYGEYVLLRPPFGWHTALLWVGPFLIFAAGLFGLIRLRRRLTPARSAPN